MLTGTDFAMLYADQAERLRAWTRRVLRESFRRPDADGEAEDMCEDVWARTWEHWSDFAELPSTGYLFNAVRNAAIDAARRRRVIGWLSLDLPERAGDGARGTPEWWTRDPRDRLTQAEMRLDLADALDLLTPTERRAFVAFHVRDQAGEGSGQAKMARLRARRRLQRCEPLALYATAS